MKAFNLITALMTATLPFDMQIKQQLIFIIVEWIFVSRQFWTVSFVVVVIDEAVAIVGSNWVDLMM